MGRSVSVEADDIIPDYTNATYYPLIVTEHSYFGDGPKGSSHHLYLESVTNPELWFEIRWADYGPAYIATNLTQQTNNKENRQ